MSFWRGTNRGRVVVCGLVACLLGALFAAASVSENPAIVRFAVIGDSGSGDRHQHQIARQMAAWRKELPFDIVLMLGDNIYGGWWRKGGKKKYFDEQFDKPYAELLERGVTFRASLGNHDAEYRDGQDLIDAHDRFHIDGPLGYYRFATGEWRSGEDGPAPLVEFFALNSTRMTDGSQDPEQLAWLERSLAASRARWRIVYGHHPLYSTGGTHGGDEGLRAKLEPFLAGTAGASASQSSATPPRVHVVLAGHDHIYQRFRPQKGVTHFVCGSSGQLRRGNARPSPEVEAFEDQQRVFMLWEATPEVLRFRAINEEGKPFDCGVARPSGSTQTVPCAALEGFH